MPAMFCAWDQIRFGRGLRRPGNTRAARGPAFEALFFLVAVLFVVMPDAISAPNDGITPDKKATFISRFGARYLKDARLVIEGEVGQVYRMGMGVDVAKVNVERVLFSCLPDGLTRKKEQLILVHKDQFTQGATLLLVLKPFRKGERMTVIHRLSPVDGDYREKVRLMDEYIRIESLPVDKRPEALARAVLLNLRSRVRFVARNSLYEIEGLLASKAWTFTTGDLEYLAKVETDQELPSIRIAVAALRARLKQRVKEGPALINDDHPSSEKRTEEEHGNGGRDEADDEKEGDDGKEDRSGPAQDHGIGR